MPQGAWEWAWAWEEDNKTRLGAGAWASPHASGSLGGMGSDRRDTYRRDATSTCSCSIPGTGDWTAGLEEGIRQGGYASTLGAGTPFSGRGFLIEDKVSDCEPTPRRYPRPSVLDGVSLATKAAPRVHCQYRPRGCYYPRTWTTKLVRRFQPPNKHIDAPSPLPHAYSMTIRERRAVPRGSRPGR